MLVVMLEVSVMIGCISTPMMIFFFLAVTPADDKIFIGNLLGEALQAQVCIRDWKTIIYDNALPPENIESTNPIILLR